MRATTREDTYLKLPKDGCGDGLLMVFKIDEAQGTYESSSVSRPGQSGAKQDRPALNSLLNDLRKRKIDVILVWSLDRLARSLKQLLIISEECRALAVDLVSLKQSIDTTLPAGRLTFSILGAVAEFERELLRERVKAGMAQAQRAGKRIGRPALRHFSPAELDRIRALRTQGTSVRKLASDFATTQWMIAKLVTPSNATEGATA